MVSIWREEYWKLSTMRYIMIVFQTTNRNWSMEMNAINIWWAECMMKLDNI